MPSRRRKKRGEKKEAIYVPFSILSNALRNAICTVSFGATILKSESISETVQNAQRKKRLAELEKGRKSDGGERHIET